MATKQHSTPKKLKKAAASSKQTTNKQTKQEPFKSRFAPDATITWAGKDNPFREKSGAWERTEIVRKASGQKVSVVQGKPGLRGSTLATLARMKLITVKGGV
jgi:hypothetical protein